MPVLDRGHLPTCSRYCCIVHCTWCGRPAMQGALTCTRDDCRHREKEFNAELHARHPVGGPDYSGL